MEADGVHTKEPPDEPESGSIPIRAHRVCSARCRSPRLLQWRAHLALHPDVPIDGSRSLLRQANTCDDLLASIQEDAVAKIEVETQQYIEWYVEQRGLGFGGLGTEDAAAPGARAADDQNSAPPDEYSETNTQVDGVDEADLVKTDGERIYALSGNELVVVDSWPAEQTHVLGRFPVEGYPLEMFVADGRAVVFSQTSDPRVAPEDAVCDDYYRDWGYYYPCYSGGARFTKITVAGLSDDGTSAVLEREVFLEGDYRSSRRHESIVRAVVNNWGYYFHWQLPQVWEYLYPDGDWDPVSSDVARSRIHQWRADAIAAVGERDLAEWLPEMLERVDGDLTTSPIDCGGFYVTRPGMADYGMTQIASLNLDDSSRPQRTGVWGAAQELYANHDTMVLAQPDYSAYYRAYVDEVREYSDATVLHAFDIGDDGATSYTASGIVPGIVVDQFSIDERGGTIRVATTESRWTPWWLDQEWSPPRTLNRVWTLQDRNAALRIVGRTPVLAEGERIFSARYVDDLAYVVTFRQVDPLFAIDLADPTNPTVLGELKIPGFSNYMQPLGDSHLLTIGRDATDEGMVQGLALQIFNVSDPTQPELRHRHVFQDEWGYSDANWDHKAFTYFGARELLAFPYVAYGRGWNSFRSSLEVFHVDAENGFRKQGSVDHTSLLQNECSDDNPYCREYGLNIRRGVFIEDYVYSISSGGIVVNDARDMSQVARLPL